VPRLLRWVQERRVNPRYHRLHLLVTLLLSLHLSRDDTSARPGRRHRVEVLLELLSFIGRTALENLNSAWVDSITARRFLRVKRPRHLQSKS
jgi:hypothetical protein